jgi:multidrug resistance efflux pump
MAAQFSRTLRSLRDDRAAPSLGGVVAAAVVLGAWVAWFTLAKVQLVETSTAARVESTGETHPVQSVVTGRVVASHLELDRAVDVGEVLVELDSSSEQLALTEAKGRRAGEQRQVDLLKSELSSEEAAQFEDWRASSAALAVSRAHEREAEAMAKLAGEESSRLGALNAHGDLGEMEALRAATEATGRQAAAEASASDSRRMSWDMRKRGSEQRATIARLYRDMAVLEGDVAQLGTQIERLEVEIEHHRVRSPASGRIGEIKPLPVGAVVQSGSVLASVVPPGELRVVAEFAAASAIGRLEPGASAQIRLDGFPWTEYGVLHATLTSVGSEARQGNVRAELRLDPTSTARVPVRHGLTGVVEVEVERVTPARLVLRTVGAAMAPAHGTAQPDGPPLAEQP